MKKQYTDPVNYSLTSKDLASKDYAAFLDGLTDVPSSVALRPFSIDRAGIKEQFAYVKVRSIDEPNTFTPILANITMQVELKGHRGIHMSRCEEALFSLVEEEHESLDSFSALLAEKILKLQESYFAYVQAEGTYIHKRHTAKTSRLTYDRMTMYATAKASSNAKTEIAIGLAAFNMTGCPCTETFTKFAVVPQLQDAGFDLDQITTIIGITNSGTHTQRGLATIKVDKTHDAVTYKRLYEALDKSCHLVYELLKRPDEHELVVRVLRNPQFTEDVVRDIVEHTTTILGEYLTADTKIFASSQLFDSIHIHDVYTEIEKTFSELMAEKEVSEAFAPAETYQLNTLASVIGRYGVSNPSADTLQQVDGMLESVIGQLVDGDVPPVPHTDPELLKEATAFDLKLLQQVETGPAAFYMSAAQQEVVRSLLVRHVDFCSDRRLAEAPWEQLVEPQAIAEAYGLPELWKQPYRIIDQEITTWGRDTQHPAIPASLRKQVEIGTTRDLMDFMWRRVVEVSHKPQVNTYLTDEVQNYHVFWAPVADGGLDYATPRSYDRAIQLSFDLPHNATHLAHLDAMDQASGARRYDDSMALRAYFEAVTVFSEYKAYELAANDATFGAELADILQLENEMTPEEIAAWVADDRKYEFKLRAVRYAADALLMQGVSFDDTVADVQQHFGISRTDAEKESRKYIAWTGLGAAYTFGYRQLQASGVTRTIDAIKNSDGQVITAWQESPRA